jgi:hypothetical protein
MAWSSLEGSLTKQYALITQGITNSSGAANSISFATFELVENVRVKREILLKAASYRFEADLVAQYAARLTKVEKAYALRNRVAHASWFLSPDYPDCIICAKRITDIAEARAYNPRMLNDLRNAIDKAHGGIEEFFNSRFVPLLVQQGREDVAFLRRLENPDQGSQNALGPETPG